MLWVIVSVLLILLLLIIVWYSYFAFYVLEPVCNIADWFDF